MRAMKYLCSAIVCKFWITVNNKVEKWEMNTKNLTVKYGHVTLLVQRKIQVNRQVKKMSIFIL